MKHTLVFDSTPLIYLGKVDLIEYIGRFENEMLIPSSIHHEVVSEGTKKGITDAIRIEKAISKDILKVVDVKPGDMHMRLSENKFLSATDIDVIQLAYAKRGIALMDERYGRNVCDVEGIEHRGTLWVLNSMMKRGIITPGECRDYLDRMIGEGWYCSTRLYSRALRTFDEY